MKRILILIIFPLVTSCAIFQPKIIPNYVLEDKLITLNRDSITFKEILNKYPNKDKFIQVFGSYCQNSQNSFSDVLKFQEENPDKEYIFLSVDHGYYDWKRSLEYVKPKGSFYLIPEKGDAVLGQFFKIKSIPRFMKIDKNKKIKLFKTSKVSKKLK